MEYLQKELKDFLKEKKVFDKFIANVERDDDDDYGGENIAGAFTWENTPEGILFWDELDEEFEKTQN